MLRNIYSAYAGLLLCFGIIVALPAAVQAIGFTELLSRKIPVPTRHFSYGPERDQFGELWLPDTKEVHPLIVLIHGGCWLAQLPGVSLMAPMAEDLRRTGIAVWNIEYRRLGTKGAGYPGTFLDIAGGIDYLRKIAGPYKLDLSHVVVAGHSAGGQLALWAAARLHITHKSALYMKDPLNISAVVTLAGINDLADYHDNGPDACGGAQTIDRLVDAHNRTSPYLDTSPAAMLPIGAKQVIISGSTDAIVPDRFGEAYAHAAEKAGEHPVALTIADADHFDLIDPESPAWPQIKARILSTLNH